MKIFNWLTREAHLAIDGDPSIGIDTQTELNDETEREAKIRILERMLDTACNEPFEDEDEDEDE